MQRYFVDPEQMTERQAVMTGDDIHHLLHVLRAKEGQIIIVSDGRGRDVQAKITDIQPEAVYVEIIQPIQRSNELPVTVTVAQGLPKGDKMEQVIQKGTELGASFFIPLRTKRSVVQLDESKVTKKQIRWQRIAKESAEQAHRSIIPHVETLHSWPDLLKKTQQYDLVVLAYELEYERTLYDVLISHRKISSFLLIVGPEGGIDKQEVKQALDAGVQTISLGRRIMRTETAAIYTLACLSYHFEQIMKHQTNHKTI